MIGGGSTGAGVALDAISRGYTCALIEQDDFASGKQHSNITNNSIDIIQALQVNQPNSCMVAFVILRKPFGILIMVN